MLDKRFHYILAHVLGQTLDHDNAHHGDTVGIDMESSSQCIWSC